MKCPLLAEWIEYFLWRNMKHYSHAAVERTMKIQEVIMRARARAAAPAQTFMGAAVKNDAFSSNPHS